MQTVNGSVSPESLGVTLAHEHIILDFRSAWIQPTSSGAHFPDAELTPDDVHWLRCNPQSSRSNLLLEDEQTAVDELKRFTAAGGRSLVDLTNTGLGPEPLRLRRISLETGLNVVAGCGYYKHSFQTPAVLSMTSDEQCEQVLKSLRVGIGETDVRAGIIGEIGTSIPVHPFERESLVAAAKAQRQTGVAISVHLDVRGRQQIDVLDILETAGADMQKTVMSHVDEVVDPDWHRDLAERGVYLSFDTFGSEFCYDGVQEPRDSKRIECLLALLERGYVDRLLLSQDTCYKIQLVKYGGAGYGHVLLNVVPRLRRAGVGDSEIRKMLVDNPRSMLAAP